jgi:hypothetical protein
MIEKNILSINLRLNALCFFLYLWKKCYGTYLISHLSEIPEFRRQNKNFKHPLSDVLFIGICAVFHRAEDFYEIADFCRERKAFLRTALTLPNGIFTHDTITRFFRTLDNNLFNKKFIAWLQDLLTEINLVKDVKHICIDGKTLRGELGLCLGQVKTEKMRWIIF